MAILLLVAATDVSCNAQTDQLLPEIDVYYKLNPNVRIWVQAKETREGGDPVSAEIGPSVDFYLKPWIKLTNATVFDLDASKKRAFILSLGYRALPAPNTPLENRFEPVATLNFPIKGGVLLSDNNRGDLDWQNGKFSWRYRNRVSLERSLRIRNYHPSPYVSAEVFYESQYSKWSDTAIYAGCLFPIRKHIEFDLYYEHQNNTGKKPNQLLNQFGLVLKLNF